MLLLQNCKLYLLITKKKDFGFFFLNPVISYFFKKNTFFHGVQKLAFSLETGIYCNNEKIQIITFCWTEKCTKDYVLVECLMLWQIFLFTAPVSFLDCFYHLHGHKGQVLWMGHYPRIWIKNHTMSFFFFFQTVVNKRSEAKTHLKGSCHFICLLMTLWIFLHGWLYE